MSDSFSVSTPSYNPAETQTLSGVLDFFQKQVLMNIEKVTPAKIISYNRENNRAVVQILNYSVTSNGENVQRKQIADIPVYCMGGGGFVFSVPVKADDIGFLIAADGDISVFKKILNLFAPATYQKHKYKDSIFFPLILNGFTFNATDNDAVILSSVNGDANIILSQGKCEVTAGNIIFNGNLTVNGDITADGTIKGTVKSDNGATGTYTNSVVAADGIVTGGS